MDREEYLRRWSALHGHASTSGLVGFWLGLTYRVAAPLARARVSPDALTLAGLVLACGVLPLAMAGGRWLLLAVPVVVLSGFVDNLDGAVALLTERTSRWGFVLDSLCDRIADAAYVVALWIVGAPGWLCAVGGAIAWLHEYTRARAAAGGMDTIGVVTVSERPTRIIVTTMFLLGAGIYPSAADLWAISGAIAWVVIGAVGLGQVLVVVRRTLSRPSGAPDELGDDCGGHRDEGQAATGM